MTVFEWRIMSNIIHAKVFVSVSNLSCQNMSVVSFGNMWVGCWKFMLHAQSAISPLKKSSERLNSAQDSDFRIRAKQFFGFFAVLVSTRNISIKTTIVFLKTHFVKQVELEEIKLQKEKSGFRKKPC